MKKRALVSVSDKAGIESFCSKLCKLGYEIISTGGTETALKAAGIPTINISDITGFPECLDGRVKTLHPAVHAGLLAMRQNPEHMKQLSQLSINTIDIVAVNLYPFKATIMKENVDFAHAVENIDIGGPTMLRSAAKNYQDVAVICDPADYEKVVSEIENGGVSLETKKVLMYKVFQHTAVYDTLIANYLREKLSIQFSDNITYAYEKAQDLRYGENPHQKAVFYKEVIPVKSSIAYAKQLHGKELSFNNINDASAALDLLKEFDEPCAVAVKHTNPCGVAIAEDISTAYKRAYEADPVSIFGGIIALNRTVDLKTAEQISKIFVEIVIAPGFEKDAFELLSKKPNVRLLQLDNPGAKFDKSTRDIKKVSGGLLVQEKDLSLYDELKVVTKAQPTEEQLKQLRFAYAIAKHCKSNAIAIAKDFASLGMGVGQTNRIWATKQAIENSTGSVEGAVLASDAFFPFGDCAEAAAKAGIKAIIHPGGSVNDQLSIDVCDKYGIAMVVCGERHFKH